MNIKLVRIAGNVSFIGGNSVKAFTAENDKITYLGDGLIDIESRGRAFVVHVAQCEYVERFAMPEAHQIAWLEAEKAKRQPAQTQLELPVEEAPQKARKEPVTKK